MPALLVRPVRRKPATTISTLATPIGFDKNVRFWQSPLLQLKFHRLGRSAPRPLGLENRSLGGLLACQERLAEQAKRGNEDNTARGEK